MSPIRTAIRRISFGKEQGVRKYPVVRAPKRFPEQKQSTSFLDVVACSIIAGYTGMLFYEYIRYRRKVTHNAKSSMGDENEKSCQSCRLRRKMVKCGLQGNT